ncbi:CLK4-associating serine/arginine rich protein [Armadillidium nasatum]|uniref:CLK4-associating serine/arginine rich protein n=1 Tax=Armadillidium nasatum TaxID=96803 RepID=A0A5N5TLC2_9CRUS|nr:CLK4-associating serine/arginine rich protein [Armadillidium nasatum]
MWHEARKQEKKIRGMLVDYKKRAERRKEYYERIKQDPTQFIQIHGRACKIHLDPAVHYAAEAPGSMMPWRGDKESMIDRFDVRAHLDDIPTFDRNELDNSTPEQLWEERQANYERYRILIQNEFLGVKEEKFLNQIRLEELFGPVGNKAVEDEKKALMPKKAAIGFVYDGQPGSNEILQSNQVWSSVPVSTVAEDAEEDSGEENLTVDVLSLTNQQQRELNSSGVEYGLNNEDFMDLMSRDLEEAEALRIAKEHEDEKAMYSGRKSRKERRALKKKHLDRNFSPPSYAARSSPTYGPYHRFSSKSHSRSPSPPTVSQIKFITSFGEDSEPGHSENEEGGVIIIPEVEGAIKPSSLSSATDRRKSSASSSSRRNKHRRRSSTSSRSVNNHFHSWSSSTKGLPKVHQGVHSIESIPLEGDAPEADLEGQERIGIVMVQTATVEGLEVIHDHAQSQMIGGNVGMVVMENQAHGRKVVQDQNHVIVLKKVSATHPPPLLPPPPLSSTTNNTNSTTTTTTTTNVTQTNDTENKDTPKLPSPPRRRYYGRRAENSDSDDESEEEGESFASTGSNILNDNSTSLCLSSTSTFGNDASSDKADKKLEKERAVKAEQERQDREEELREIAIKLRRREREKRHRLHGDESHSDDSLRSRSRSNSRSPKSIRSRSDGRYRDSERDREGDGSRMRDRGRDRSSRERDSRRYYNRSRSRERDRERERQKDRDRGGRDRYRPKESASDRDRDRDRDSRRGREEDNENRDRDRRGAAERYNRGVGDSYGQPSSRDRRPDRRREGSNSSDQTEESMPRCDGKRIRLVDY